MKKERQPVARIVEELQRGVSTEDNFRELFDRHYKQVVYFFVRRGFDIEESRDLAQETFLRMLEKISSFRGESKFSTWLLSIAVRVANNELRQRSAGMRSGIEVPVELVEDTATQPAVGSGSSSAKCGERLDELLDEKRKLEQLYQEIAQLPRQARWCLFLRFDQGLKYREIATVLQISIGAVKSHLHNALNKLKARFNPHLDDEDGG
jgi:RNA polymerase sigma-70 factor (ECF subfamily)